MGYQAIQSRIAIGAGGTSGAGFLQGVQTQTSMLPEKHTDFIFSVAAEEFGLWGALAVLVLLAFLCLRVLAAARRAKDRGGYLICMGVFASLMFQTVENIGMCLGVLPVVGLTLPLFSYGGSSVVSIYLSVGLVQGCDRARTDGQFHCRTAGIKEGNRVLTLYTGTGGGENRAALFNAFMEQVRRGEKNACCSCPSSSRSMPSRRCSACTGRGWAATPKSSASSACATASCSPPAG